jgi:hypothetical protein
MDRRAEGSGAMRIRQRLGRGDGPVAVESALIFGMLQLGLTLFELQSHRASTHEGGRLGAVEATPDVIRPRIESAWDPKSNLRAEKLCDPGWTGSCGPVNVPNA